MKKTKKLGLKKPDTTDFFNVEDLNENFEAIDSEFEEICEKIGDVKITTREINVPTWLLCNNTHVSEEEYPDLYYVVNAAADSGIYKKEWRSMACSNDGYPPLFAADGYIYFFPLQTSVSTISRCNADYTGFETYSLPFLGYVCYENGCFFLFTSVGSKKMVICSTDGFKTYSTLDISDKVYSDCDNFIKSLVRYTGSKWFIKLPNSEGYIDFLSADTVEGPYLNDFSFHYSHGLYEKDGEWRSCRLVDMIQYKNGAYFGLLSYHSSSSHIHICRKTDDIKHDGSNIWLPYGTDIDDFTESFSAQLAEKDNINPIYIPEIDTVFCYTTNLPQTQREGIYAYKNDGSFFYVPAAGNPTKRMTIVYFKGFVYFKEDGSTKITRVNANSLYDTDFETSTEFVTTNDISASEQCIFMPKDTSNMYYMETDKEVMIPAAHPNTVFKTYIKCRRGDTR